METAQRCPCGEAGHELATHPTAERYGFTPVFGEYLMDDPIAEHRDGEHDDNPQPECCAVCRVGEDCDVCGAPAGRDCATPYCYGSLGNDQNQEG